VDQLTSDSGQALRIASANMEGGLSPAGDVARLARTIGALRGWDLDAVLFQEVTARSEPELTVPMREIPHAERARRVQEMTARAEAKTKEHMERIAGQLGMTPVLGPPAPMSFSRNHPAVLIRSDHGFGIVQAGPPPAPAGGLHPAWCLAVVSIAGIANRLALYSLHMPARSAVAQRLQAEWLTSLVAQRGELAIVGGDFNSYPRAGAPGGLEALPARLRPPRMTGQPGGLRPGYAVHDAFTAIEMVDAAAHLPGARRDPPQLSGTGRYGRERTGRFYVTRELAPALRGYRQQDTGGSDHKAILLTLDLAALAAATPPGPRP
jgi:endonuclease/exonuclease/phosphatase family metal-dependent hydrolase